MLMKVLAVVAILVFVAWVIGVLQGWSKGTTINHVTGVGFILLFGAAAAWGLRVLGVLFRWAGFRACSLKTPPCRLI